MREFKTSEKMHKRWLAGVPSCAIMVMHTGIGICGPLYLKRGSSVQESAKVLVCNGAIPF